MTIPTPLTAAELLATVRLGDVVRFSNGEPQPPARFNKKLAAWKDKNATGVVTRIEPNDGRAGNFTLHLGNLGGNGVILIRRYSIVDVATASLTYTIERRAAPGSILCCYEYAGRREVQDICESLPLAEHWLRRHASGVLLQVQDDGSLKPPILSQVVAA